MREPLIPIDPDRRYTQADFDRIREQEERYQALLDRKYDLDGMCVTARRKPSTRNGTHIALPKKRRCLLWTPEGLKLEMR